MSPGSLCVALEGALHARICSRMAFLLFSEAGDVMGGTAAPLLG